MPSRDVSGPGPVAGRLARASAEGRRDRDGAPPGPTCDPVGGLVQVPEIERNAMGAVKAITAAHLALEGDPARAKANLDAAIRSMLAKNLDMNINYWEAAEGCPAVQVPVDLNEC